MNNTYRQAFLLKEEEQLISEISERKAIGLFHIIGGENGVNRIENIIALTKQEQGDYLNKADYKSYLLKIHRDRLIEKEIHHNGRWFDHYISKFDKIEAKSN
jgi:hypothetical protein